MPCVRLDKSSCVNKGCASSDDPERTDDLREDSTSVRNKQQQVQVGGES